MLGLGLSLASRGSLGSVELAQALWLDGSSGTYASTPHSDALAITGDMTLVAMIAPKAWVGVANDNIIMARRQNDVGSRAFQLSIHPSGQLRAWFFYGPEAVDGSLHSETFTGPENGGPLWVAWTLGFGVGVDERSSSQFYTSQDGSAWEALGSPRTTGWTGIHPAVSPLEIGARSGGSLDRFMGAIYRAQLYRGAGFDLSSGPTGTLVADFNAEDATRGQTTFDSIATGEKWTLHGNASIRAYPV